VLYSHLGYFGVGVVTRDGKRPSKKKLLLRLSKPCLVQLKDLTSNTKIIALKSKLARAFSTSEWRKHTYMEGKMC
jgi:hypothetical protein